MHTDLCDTSRDLMIGFRSSPYGSYNHMHCDQNSFNVLAGGRRLFEGSGYYIAYGDDHFTGWYTASRGHNTVLVDGRGQVRGPDGFGVVSRFLHGGEISYCLGDASRAYGNAGLTAFRRHLALLRPGTIVVYDELAADHAARWSWLLHSKERIGVEGETRLRAANDTGQAVVDLFASGPLEVTVDHEFDPPAVNWRNRKSGNEVIEYPDQWHATATSVEPSSKMRILAVIQVRVAGRDAAAKPSWTAFDEPAAEAAGRVRLGPWRIEAELDTSQGASLLVTGGDGRTVLAADGTSVTAAGKTYDLPPLTSLLVEDKEGIVVRCRDELPPAAQ